MRLLEAKANANKIDIQSVLLVNNLKGYVVIEAINPSNAYMEAQRRDGETVRAGEILVTLTGPMRAILTGERTALNFLARLCGISSLTRRFVEAVAGTRASIVDTRKTTPGWRLLEKYATGVGGALRHRTSLSDGILLKDNHIAAAGGVEPAVKAALLAAPAHLRVQVEVQSEAEAALAIAGGVDFLLIDNCAPEEVGRIAGRWGDRVLLEASGGIDLSNAVAYAETGVQRLSIGALTHSAKGSDVALEIEPGGVAG